MNRIEEEYFDLLSKDRSEIADMLERPAVRGYKDSVVEKYSDQAHFIYELLQNADDAKATSARFLLKKDCLIFAHNGTRLFSVSNPQNEEIDSKNKTLGDINAITSIANSNKSEASIGKFGVGFKAVFQYTSTPRVYDPNFRFKIERFIVPIKIDEDYPERKPDETLFVFPFDHPERTETEAYNDIADKLKNLSYPLLFLSNLKNIDFEFSNVIGLYDKIIKESKFFDDTKAERIVLTQNAGEVIYDEQLWLFTRKSESNMSYSVGFFMDEDGHLKPVNEPAFCFFPTKEVTNLSFIIHAPFLLTDSREGIRAGVRHNDYMIELLSDLAADSLEYLKDISLQSGIRLIDDGIIEIIPYDEEKFVARTVKSKVSFKPFYEAIKDKLHSSELIPSISGCVSSENAYWAAVPKLTQVFNDEQLGLVTDNEEAQWAFVSLGRDEIQSSNKALANYIDNLVRSNLSEDNIINGRNREYFFDRFAGVRRQLDNVKGIDSNFVESQSVEWLHTFYKWLSETSHRTSIIKKKPIFIDQNGKAAAAFDEDNQLILFFSIPDIKGYTVVNDKLLDNEDTVQFLKDIGVSKPSLKDQIYNIILPQYKDDDAEIDTSPHFSMFFKYYCDCARDEEDEFIDLIKDCDFLEYMDGEEKYRTSASELYVPSSELKQFLSGKESVKYVCYEQYKEIVGSEKERLLNSFLSDLGVSFVPRKTCKPYSVSTNRKETEYYLDGLIKLIEKIANEKNTNLSVFLWHQLCKIVCEPQFGSDIFRKTVSVRANYRRKFETTYEDSSTLIKLRTCSWILCQNGEFEAPSEIYQEDISEIYNQNVLGADKLLALLKLKTSELEDDSNLTDSQKVKIAFANRLQEYGINNEEDLTDFLKEYKRKKDSEKFSKENANYDNLTASYSGPNNVNEGQSFASFEKEVDGKTADIIKDITRRTVNKPKQESKQSILDEDVDSDEYMPSSVDYEKKIERAKEKSVEEINKIKQFEELQRRVEESQKYSYGWFKALLEMECLNSGESNANSKEVSIAFSKVEREAGTIRTLVLKYPNRYIPQFMEDLADIPLVLHFEDRTKTVAIEVANIKSYTLRVKVKNADDISDINFDEVSLATIDAKSPAFLLEELRKQFSELEYEDSYDMQKNLCENIEFVFGPPGTGKTTHLAKNVLIPMMKENDSCRVLVLTPTNKAADVLVRRIMEVSGEDHSYNKWLVRFGATGDEEIEQSPVYKDKTFDIRELSKSVTVTTIARFPYDFFMPESSRLFLYALNWDYIVIDEASMIPIANIVFPLYKKTPQKFIIAGDPFQIEPITSVDFWKNENIYTLVHLDSFVNPQTIPYSYKIEYLTTQYRSVPDIGDIFSKFAYGGILKHFRTSDSQKLLNVGDDLGIETLNVIKFPVSKYESIYKCKRLQHSSSYQVYAALFTFEYVCYLSRAISENNPGGLFRIGVIAPYRAQSDLINKLISSEKLPKEVDVQVGTIHGFQGDECDIIFSVFNSPPSISNSNEMFLNKMNIINVSISRARDYLFIVMPDDKTENVDNLRLVKKVENLIHETDVWNEFLTHDLEDLMFDDENYIENNSFTTGHQSVNVYGIPEKRYEVRTEDSAVDIQIHRVTVDDFQRMEINNLRKEEYVESYDLDETKIPEHLRKDSSDMQVKGALKGWYFLAPYEGKLRFNTTKELVTMYIPLEKDGITKMINVKVDIEDRIIYIARDMFERYEEGLSEPEPIEIRRGLNV